MAQIDIEDHYNIIEIDEIIDQIDDFKGKKIKKFFAESCYTILNSDDLIIDIDINDHLDELETDQMIEELQKKGYHVLEENQIDYIIGFLENEGFKVISDYQTINFTKESSKEDFKRELCDLFNVGYHTGKKELLKLVSDML